MTTVTVPSLGEETEVTEKAKRRTFTLEYKRRIVREADGCKKPGAIGALLRREGLFSSHLTIWRQQRDRGELVPGVTAKKRGPKASPPDPRDVELARLKREIARLQARADRAEALVEIQKKVAALLGKPIEGEES
jgi:transposase